jgi:hypothetical protein
MQLNATYRHADEVERNKRLVVTRAFAVRRLLARIYATSRGGNADDSRHQVVNYNEEVPHHARQQTEARHFNSAQHAIV